MVQENVSGPFHTGDPGIGTDLDVYFQSIVNE